MHLLFLLTAFLRLVLCFRMNTSFRPPSRLKMLVHGVTQIYPKRRGSTLRQFDLKPHENNLRKWVWVKKSLFFSKFSWGVEQWSTKTLLVSTFDFVMSLYGLILVLIGLFDENEQIFVALSNSNISHAVPSIQCLHISNCKEKYILLNI